MSRPARRSTALYRKHCHGRDMNCTASTFVRPLDSGRLTSPSPAVPSGRSALARRGLPFPEFPPWSLWRDRPEVDFERDLLPEAASEISHQNFALASPRLAHVGVQPSTVPAKVCVELSLPGSQTGDEVCWQVEILPTSLVAPDRHLARVLRHQLDRLSGKVRHPRIVHHSGSDVHDQIGRSVLGRDDVGAGQTVIRPPMFTEQFRHPREWIRRKERDQREGWNEIPQQRTPNPGAPAILITHHPDSEQEFAQCPAPQPNKKNLVDQVHDECCADREDENASAVRCLTRRGAERDSRNDEGSYANAEVDRPGHCATPNRGRTAFRRCTQPSRGRRGHERILPGPARRRKDDLQHRTTCPGSANMTRLAVMRRWPRARRTRESVRR